MRAPLAQFQGPGCHTIALHSHVLWKSTQDPHSAFSSQKTDICLLRPGGHTCGGGKAQQCRAAHLALLCELQPHFQGQLSSNPLLYKQSHILIKATVHGELLKYVKLVCSLQLHLTDAPISNWTVCNGQENDDPSLHFGHACVPGSLLDASIHHSAILTIAYVDNINILQMENLKFYQKGSVSSQEPRSDPMLGQHENPYTSLSLHGPVFSWNQYYFFFFF